MTEANVQTTGPADGHCKTDANTTNGGIWATNSDTDAAGDKAACKTVCTDINGSNGAGVLFDAGSSRGDSKYCQFSTAQPTVAYYCGGYSYEAGAATNAKCKILYGASDPVINAGDSAVSTNKCESITASTQLAEFHAL